MEVLRCCERSQWIMMPVFRAMMGHGSVISILEYYEPIKSDDFYISYDVILIDISTIM